MEHFITQKELPDLQNTRTVFLPDHPSFTQKHERGEPPHAHQFCTAQTRSAINSLLGKEFHEFRMGVGVLAALAQLMINVFSKVGIKFVCYLFQS